MTPGVTQLAPVTIQCSTATAFVAAGDDEGFGGLGQAGRLAYFLEHVVLRAGTARMIDKRFAASR